MKMNRFRVNLHPAFFDPDKLDKTVNEPQTKEQLEKFTAEELNNLKKEILDDVSGKKSERISNRGNEQSDFDKSKTNDDIWTENATEGYGHLIATLKENHYFDGMDEKEQTDELKKIKQMYVDEVKEQYKKVVGKKSYKKFDRVDQDLFDKNSPDSPANKIYTQLTGAATIRTVDRQYTEGYDVDILGSQSADQAPEGNADQTQDGGVETEVDRKNRKFLSNDLPEYLWDIRKTPGALKALSILPIFSVKTDRPSEIDRDAISDFIKAANRIPTKDGKSPVMVLLEALHDNELNTNSTVDNYTVVLKKHGMDLDGFKKENGKPDYKEFRKCISRVVEVGKFYINTQRADADVKDQHAIYLSVLGIIENSGGAENAVNKFRSIVEDAKKTKKTEKKEGYSSGEKLGEINSELYEIAKNLGITDFASATRLSELNKEYFERTSLENILANLNNDNVIDARDTMTGGLKTGSQFLEVFKQVSDQIGKEKVLSNLVNHAKLLNETLGVGLSDVLLDPKTIESDIKSGHTGIILLLQNIISNPGEDLYTLLSGHTENPFEGLNLKAERARVDEYVEKMVKKMDMQALRDIGLMTPENIHAGLSGALFEEYKRGIGVGGKISFDQWVKGLDMNTGFQVRGDGTVVVGIGLNYRKKINLGKGWSTTPELSAGAFIPLGKGKPEISGTVGLNDEVAKERVTKNGVQQKLGMQAGVTLLIPTATPVVSAGLSWERDKASGIEKREGDMRKEMKKSIGDVLERIFEKRKEIKTPGATNLNFADKTLVSTVKQELEAEAKNLGVSEKDMGNVVDATLRLLLNYNNANLADEGVIDIIAARVADQYAMAWSEYRKAHISESTYLSGANLGVFWVVGSPLVGVYAGIKWTDHDVDGYGDRWGEGHTIDNSKETSEGVWTEKSIESLNARLGLAENQRLMFADVQNPSKGIIIPKSITNRVKIRESMKQLLAKDESGNVIISPWTTMGESIVAGAATQSKELVIGEGNSNLIALDTVNQEWFAQSMEDVNKKILAKENNEHFHTKEGIINAINKLKAETENESLKNFKPTDLEVSALIDQLNKLTDQNKKAKIIIERQSDGKFTMTAENGTVEGKGLELEYRAKLEMFDSKAKELANKVYEWAASLTNPEALNRVKHPLNQRHPDYENFVNKLMGSDDVEKDVQGAKEAVVKIIEDLNKKYPNNNLTIGDNDWPTDSEALEQALMSINNVFARSTKVKGMGTEEGGINKYGFTTNMGAIIAEREGQIGSTLDGKIKGDPDVKSAYRNLIKAMANDRKANQKSFETRMAKAAHLDNAVGFNLGDKYNPENPLFNPEIYEQEVSLDKEIFTEEDSKVLHHRAVENFVGNTALFKPIKEALGISSNDIVKIKEGSDLDNGVIELDIGGKIIKLKSDMKFGYFTQCVNHTVILDNIQLEDQQGNVMNFTSGTWKNGKYVEGSKTSIVSTTEVGMSVSFIVHDGRNEPEEKPDYEDGSNPSNGEQNDRTIPETEGGPIGEDVPSDGMNGTDNLWTEGGQKGPNGDPNHDEDGGL